MRHLIREDEILGARLITYHNLYLLKNTMHNIREAIKEDRLGDFLVEFQAKFGDKAF